MQKQTEAGTVAIGAHCDEVLAKTIAKIESLEQKSGVSSKIGTAAARSAEPRKM